MKKLKLNQMEKIEGGCNAGQERAAAWIGLGAGFAALAGPIGMMIAGPTALGVAIVTVYCQYH